MKRLLILLVMFIALGIGGLVWMRTRDFAAPSATASSAGAPARSSTGSATAASPMIDKQPPVVATRRFDPAAPPPEMPPLHAGEQAQCDSSFMSSAIVSGQPRRSGATTATLTITQVRMTLQLVITIWVPDGVTQHVLEHEEGHRQISEFYYQNADQVAERIAASYIGREFSVSGSDLDAEASQMLQQVGEEITAEYNKQLNPEPAQLHFDEITDHARNEMATRNAVAEALQR